MAAGSSLESWGWAVRVGGMAADPGSGRGHCCPAWWRFGSLLEESVNTVLCC